MAASAAPQKPTGPFIRVRHTEEGVRSLVAATGLEARITLDLAGLFEGTYMISISDPTKIGILMRILRRDYVKLDGCWTTKVHKRSKS